MIRWLALDIGGANLKVADGRGYARSYGFRLWEDSERLQQELRHVIVGAPPSDHLAVTMTGELADCFESKQEGVEFILDSVSRAADGRHTRVYLTSGEFVAPAIARRRPLEVASANWHALATYCGRFAQLGSAVLLDVGSTTVDILPLQDGRPVVKGKDDLSRLLHGELVYTGVERSMVCAIAGDAEYRGQRCPLANERFATMRDVYLVTGDLKEAPRDCETADGRPATVEAAIGRLRRSICASVEQFGASDATSLAHSLADAQLDQVADAADRVLQSLGDTPQTWILSGHGRFLARRVIARLQPDVERRVVSLKAEIGSENARCAPAYALAVLAREAVTQP